MFSDSSIGIVFETTTIQQDVISYRFKKYQVFKYNIGLFKTATLFPIHDLISLHFFLELFKALNQMKSRSFFTTKIQYDNFSIIFFLFL